MAKKKPTWAQQLKAENAELVKANDFLRSSISNLEAKHVTSCSVISSLVAQLDEAKAEAEQHRKTALKLTEAQIVGAIGRGGRFRRLKDHLTLNEAATL